MLAAEKATKKTRFVMYAPHQALRLRAGVGRKIAKLRAFSPPSADAIKTEQRLLAGDIAWFVDLSCFRQLIE